MTGSLASDGARVLLALSWQVALLVLALALLERFVLRGAMPRLSLALWSLVPLKLLLPPSLSASFSVTTVATRHVAPSMGPAAPLPSASHDATLLLGVWVLGMLVFAHRALRRRRRLLGLAGDGFVPPARVARQADRAARALGLSRTPTVRLHPAVPGPLVFGLGRPVILLPVEAADPRAFDDETLAHALLHELAHVRRGDLWQSAGFALLALVHWFNPLVAYARRRAHAAREVCCDLTVAGTLGDATAYRHTLLALAVRGLARPAPLAGASRFLPCRSTLLVRLGALERYRGRPGGAARVATLAATLFVGGLLVPTALEARRPDVLGAELEAAQTHLEATLAGDARYGCFDKRLAYFNVVRLQTARDAMRTRMDGGDTP